MTEFERASLLSESQWCMNWALVFVIAAILAEFVAIAEISADDIGTAMEIALVSLVPGFISLCLFGKSVSYHRRYRGD